MKGAIDRVLDDINVKGDLALAGAFDSATSVATKRDTRKEKKEKKNKKHKL